MDPRRGFREDSQNYRAYFYQLSSIEALARSLNVHHATVERQWDSAAAHQAEAAKIIEREGQLFINAPDAVDDRGELTDEELESEEAAAIQAVTLAAEAETSRDAAAQVMWRRELALLDRMREIAENSRHTLDGNTRALIDWIGKKLCPELPAFGRRAGGLLPKWSDRRVLIFTENREGTKRYPKTILGQAIEGTG